MATPTHDVQEEQSSNNGQFLRTPAPSNARAAIHGIDTSSTSTSGPSRANTPAPTNNHDGVEIPDSNMNQAFQNDVVHDTHQEQQRADNNIVFEDPTPAHQDSDRPSLSERQEQQRADNDMDIEDPTPAHQDSDQPSLTERQEISPDVQSGPHSESPTRPGLESQPQPQPEAQFETELEAAPDVSPTEDPVTIFRVRITEKGCNDRYFYSDSTFDSSSFNSGRDAGSPETLFDVYTDIEGKTPDGQEQTAKKKSMQRSEWWMVQKRIDLEKDFDVGISKKQLLLVRDQGLRWAFRELVEYDPSLRVSGKSIPIHEPYPLIMWYHRDLEHLKKDLQEVEEEENYRWKLPREVKEKYTRKKIADGIGKLLSFVTPFYDDIVPEIVAQELYAPVPSERAAADFKYLWLLLKSGEMAYVKVEGGYSAVIITEAKKVDASSTHAAHCRVTVWSYRLVSGLMVRHSSIIRIEEYQDHLQINLLPVFPCRYLHDDKARRDKLEERGRHYFRLIRQDFAHMHYNGTILDPQRTEYNGHIVLDASSYMRYYRSHDEKRVDDFIADWMGHVDKHDITIDPLEPKEIIEPEDAGGGKRWQALHKFDPKKVDISTLEDRHYILFPSRVLGMTIKDKRWAKFDVKSVQDIKWPHGDALSNLVLPRESLRLLKAACPRPSSKRDTGEWSADFETGKGEGKVFLLHGPPGTGKTFTAECMAKHNKQILLSLTVSDIGTNEVIAEQKLSKWFELARRWKSILLLDEADVFMESRTVKDLRQNTLVSVFLRTMEYYAGTLFMTTNRIGHIDPAISSRVQVAIYYPPFGIREVGSRSTSRLDQVKIWEQLFDRLGELRQDVDVDQDTRDRLLDPSNVIGEELNPREIRNAFNLAIELSEYGAASRNNGAPQDFRLKFADLKRAVEMRERFKRLCNAAAGADSEEARAEMAGDRRPPPHDDY